MHAQVAPEPDDRGRQRHRGSRRDQARGLNLRTVPDDRTRLPLFPLGMVALPERDRAAAHLRGALQDDDRGVPRAEREFGIVVGSDDGLRPVGCAVRDRPRCWSAGRRADEHPHPRHAAVPLVERAERPALPAGEDRVPRRRGRGAPTPTRRATRTPPTPTWSSGHRRRPRGRRPRRPDRLRDGRHRRLRPRGQAGPARPALRERPPAPRRAPAPCRHEAARAGQRCRGGRPLQRAEVRFG